MNITDDAFSNKLFYFLMSAVKCVSRVTRKFREIRFQEQKVPGQNSRNGKFQEWKIPEL